jgi:uncharacterized membrane protein/mono/diheme cytochrome c family protein
MVPSSDKSKPPFRLPCWLGWLGVLLLGALAFRFPPDGLSRAPLGQFFGRFHPVLVHLPIALILLVPVLEIAARFPRWAALRAAAGFVLVLATLAALVAAFDGWLLARTGGQASALVIRHMWAGIALSPVCLILLWLRPRSGAGYSLLLAGAVGLLVWTSDQGGAITHGPTYLTEYLPGRARGWLGLARPALRPPPLPPSALARTTLYAARIAPLLTRNCVACHGQKKVKGGLRLDSYAGILRGGEDGPALAPWHPEKSELLRRVTLPADDDDAMPSGGRKALTPAEIGLLRAWIAAGASDKEPADVIWK